MNLRTITMMAAGLALSATMASAQMGRESEAEGVRELQRALGGPRVERSTVDPDSARGPGRFSQRGQRGQRGERGGDGQARKQQMLERFDADGDGQLSETERAAVKAHFEEQKAAFIAKWDADNDGALSEDEKTVMKVTIKGEVEALKAEMLTKFDADGDGKLTGEERKLAREASRERMQEITGGFGMHPRGGQRGGAGGPEGRGARRGANAGPGLGGPGLGGPGAREQMKTRMLEKFDADGDGALSETERQAAREAMQGMRSKRGESGPRGQRGQRGGARWVDANRDGVIDASEFALAADAVSKGEKRADFNRDGEVNAEDLALLTERAGGL